MSPQVSGDYGKVKWLLFAQQIQSSARKFFKQNSENFRWTAPCESSVLLLYSFNEVNSVGHCCSCIIHEFPHWQSGFLCVYCVLYELWICRADLCDQIIQRYANKLDTENIYFVVCKPNTYSIVDNWLQIYILLMCTSVYFILIPCLISRLCSFTPSTFVRLPHSAVHALPLPTAVRTALETCSAPRPCLGSQWSKLFSSQRAINGAKPCCMQLARLQRRCNSEMVERNHEIRTHVEGIKHTSA